MPAGESEARAKTRDRFNEVLKKYTDTPSDGKRLKKKKKSEPRESIVLKTLKTNLDLEKETEDETVLQNTYRPERGSPRFTKNKRRETEVAEKFNINNSENQEETRPSKGKKRSKRELPVPPGHEVIPPEHIQSDGGAQDADAPGSEVFPEPDAAAGAEPRRRSKKGRNKGDVRSRAESQLVDPENEHLREYQQQIAREEEKEEEERTALSSAPQDPVLNNDVGKKKKKKLKSANADSEIRDEDEGAELDVDTENKAESKGKKKKKKKQTVKEAIETEEEVPQGPVFDDSLVLGVHIHRTERLKTDLLISHPMVKIHIVDEMSGQYVKKEHSQRPVSSFYEQENVEHVLPIMTQPFDFKKNKSTVPEWEEQIIFNERFGYFLQRDSESPRVILFFEVLDFMTMEEARADVDKQGRGFRKIAWGFLKLVGTNGVLNIDTKLRLQLFCPPARAKRQSQTIEVVEWWTRYPRHRYASTLYITVKGIKLPDHVDPSMRSMMALQEERGSTSYSELQSEVTKQSLTQPQPESKPSALKWSRIPGQVCRIPNKAVHCFRGGQMGCFTVRFSRTGTMLAAACADRDAFPVVVYEIPSGTVLAAFNGHLGIVYDLCWSGDDRGLLSASSDGTVRAWDMERLLGIAKKVLPHPSFVYCAQYHPTSPNLVVTGGYDGLLRAWRLDVDDVNGQLLQEFQGHGSFINAACFDSEGRRMFSADNSGVIIVWKTSLPDSPEQQPCHGWSVEKRLDEKGLSGIPITMLEVHPNGRRLLIHAKDSVLRVMDLRILAVKKYTGATNYRDRIYSTFTPCGSFIFSGSEDGMTYVWNAETGDQVAVYSELCYPTALRGVAFHPHENMVAFCAFGQSQPIHVYLYDRKVSQLEAQSLKGAGLSSPADPKSLAGSSEPALLRDPLVSLATDQFAKTARLSLKMHRVREKLDSVLEPRHGSAGYVYERDKVGRTPTAESLILEPGATGPNASLLPPPSFLSPHSKMQLSAALAEQLIPQAARSSQNRGFSPVGQRLKGASARQLQMGFSDGVFPQDPTETDPDSVHTVVLLYDYSANRSDELTVHRGDVIQVLYKDNDSWWFGRLTNGQQGYFPATYVAEERDLHREEAHSALSDETVERSTPTKVSAAISSTGELKFLSEHDTEPESTETKRQRRKKWKKAEAPLPPPLAASSDPEVSGSSGGRRRARPLPKRPTGRANGAFEPDV